MLEQRPKLANGPEAHSARCAGVWVSAARAQEYRATLTGRVIDEQAAALPGVTVVATQIATGTKSESVTDGRAVHVPPPAARRLQRHRGARRLRQDLRDHVPLGTGQRVTLDLTLKVAVPESITVAAADTAADGDRLGRVERRSGADRQPADERPRALEPGQAGGGVPI